MIICIGFHYINVGYSVPALQSSEVREAKVT
jgi:hypothetical protein